ncbi:MAG: phosphodiesterase [Actinomycetota bacterium]|nr:phosphodiesterase [Actinomycetota bacterium]
MKIGLISDTHGYIDAWEKAEKVFEGADLVIHMGDILGSGPFNPRYEEYNPMKLAHALNSAPFPMVFAQGNCDAQVDTIALEYPIQAPYALVYSGGLSLMATHGHTHREADLLELGGKYNLDIVALGHTHVIRLEKRGDLLIVNPGSAALPKGDEDFPTVGLVEDGFVRIVSLVDGSEVRSLAVG